jgi:uncharacterized membrane protein
MYSFLAFGFGRSLGRGHIALCTRLADRLHGPLTPREVRYTRQVTAAWAIFFGALTLTILGLYCLASVRAWSLFGLMFAVEYAVRRHALPETERRGILASVRVFMSSR